MQCCNPQIEINVSANYAVFPIAFCSALFLFPRSFPRVRLPSQKRGFRGHKTDVYQCRNDRCEREKKEGQEQDEMEEGGAFFPKSQTLTSQARLLPCPGFSLLYKLTWRISLSWPTKCREMDVVQCTKTKQIILTGNNKSF